MNNKPKIIVVVPAYNEEGSIESLIGELNQFSPPENYDFDFVVVDDGSKDRTKEIVLKTGANLVSLPQNMGIGICVQTGFKYAIKKGASFVVQVDGDGQHLPSEINKLVATLEQEKSDVVIGTRFLQKQGDNLESTTRARWLGGRLLALTIKTLTGKYLTDTTSGFRLYNRAASEFIAENYPDDYPEVEILVMLALKGFNINEVPVKMRQREHGQSSINWWRSGYYIIKVIFASVLNRIRR